MFAILILQLNPLVMITSMALVTICFSYKTYEFIINNYCYIAAHIVLVYKSVLFHMILSYAMDNID